MSLRGGAQDEVQDWVQNSPKEGKHVLKTKPVLMFELLLTEAPTGRLADLLNVSIHQCCSYCPISWPELNFIAINCG